MTKLTQQKVLYHLFLSPKKLKGFEISKYRLSVKTRHVRAWIFKSHFQFRSLFNFICE